MNTTPLSPWKTILTEDAATYPSERGGLWHLEMAERYAQEAAAAMRDLTGGLASPPHALRFAEMHASLAQAIGLDR